jgi:protein involved in polysaccharide export with SLBB domain
LFVFLPMNRVVFRGPRWLLAVTLMGVAGSTPLVAPRPAWAQMFKLGPDDVIAVQVANHPEMSAAELSVGGDGKVALPLVGNLTVKGKTLAQAQTSIALALKAQLRNPLVTVALVRTHPRQVIALGAVNKPGPVDVQPGWRVSELFAAVGGLALPDGSIDNLTATLTRGKALPMPLDLKQISASPQNSANVKITTGDVINVVPLPVSNIMISGDVVTPKMATLRHAPRALDAIKDAGGLKSKPEVTRASILRGASTKISLDLPAIFADSSSAANVPLKDGDLLSVETIRTNVTVFSVDNLVKSPGSYEFGTDATVVNAVVKAGGLTAAPDNVVASIRRGAQIMPVNLERAIYDPSKDVPMIQGDVLLLAFPEGPQVTLSGAIARPGTIRVKTGTTLLDAVIQAGGLTFKPDQIRMTVLRTMPDGKQITLSIDPVALFDLRDLGQNLKLQQGDLVVANQGALSQTVFVSGEIASPGAFELNPKDGLPEAILRAGGPTKLAALRQVNITRRDGTTQIVDVSPAFGPNPAKINFPLQPGDIVAVPLNPNRVLVTNAVATPGYVPIPENGTLTIGDAIMAAGGARPGAKLNEIIILNRKADGTVDNRKVSLADVRKGVMNNDMPLRAGDVVFVPEGRTGPSSIQKGAQALASVTTLLRFGTFF